jgi:uncharacterized protein
MNRLSREKSPYLLQHAANPVDWYPWGDEAFEAARASARPIFLSVGYATCHWCHVMEHESFEDEGIARLLNEHFVPIKVDREERPDVDRVYMTFVQATTGGGGWPMSVWLTPDLQPFHGGTYFPPASRWGRPGFADILQQIADLWRTDRERILQSAGEVSRRIAQAAEVRAGDAVPGTAALDRAAREFEHAFDRRFGGFGTAPKFPRPSELLFLLREHRRAGSPGPGLPGGQLLDMVLRTLHAMADGGMRDQVGGGFHRYSVDGQWRVPHFEKMLYDQAQLALAFIEGAQASGELELLDVAEDTLRYVQRDMTGPDGGFYSAEDADSVPPDAPPGTHEAEGAFYIWRADEVGALLGDDGPAFAARYGIEASGNALQDPQGEFTERNILYAASPVDEIAGRLKEPVETVQARLERGRRRLLDARAGRPRPRLDDKVLTAWNGLMIGAFAWAARVVAAMREGSEAACSSYVASARRAASFVRERLWDEDRRRLLRRFRDKEASIDAYAEDHACLVFGLLELFEADGDAAWLTWALDVQQRQDELFWDAEAGGWFATTGTDASVRLRLKEDYDGAEPSATSIGALNLLRLGHLTGDPFARARVEAALRLFAPRIEAMARAVPMMLAALSTWHAGVQQVVVAGDGPDGTASALLRVVNRAHLPFAVVVPMREATEALRRAAPLVAAMPVTPGRATAFVCRDFACRAPTGDPAVLAEQLRGLP